MSLVGWAGSRRDKHFGAAESERQSSFSASALERLTAPYRGCKR